MNNIIRLKISTPIFSKIYFTAIAFLKFTKPISKTIFLFGAQLQNKHGYP